MSPADSADGVPLRQNFGAELQELSIQVEMMGIVVDQNLERMLEVLRSGNLTVADEAIAMDDRIDAINVSLMERCHDLLRREAPVASDLRLIVSSLRVVGEFERVGDLALRVVKLAPDFELLSRIQRAFDILQTMGDHAVERYRDALRAWSALDLDLATRVATEPPVGIPVSQLIESLLAYDGEDAVAVALRTMVAGQALDRIADHAAVLGARIRYLITGDPDHLAAEVR
ncbi:PhoU Phosphate uptake regulator [Acidimicrobiia bacterium]